MQNEFENWCLIRLWVHFHCCIYVDAAVDENIVSCRVAKAVRGDHTCRSRVTRPQPRVLMGSINKAGPTSTVTLKADNHLV